MSSYWSSSSANRSLAWSLGNNGLGRFLLEFPLNLDWYYEQPFTEFQSLEHRKERTGFQHEFIVLILLDGSICRLERMGDPDARFDALRSQGSIAHDIAQYFPPDKLSEACLGTSDIVAEITFPHRLDIIDVLRVCRAIHEGEKTRNYTLQCFNCYFFAIAIQSVLTRLVAGWGETFTLETWRSGLQNVRSDLTDVYQTPRSARDERPPFIRIYSLLKSDIQWPAEDLLGQLLDKLYDPESFTQIRKAWNSVLWHSDVELAVDYVVENRAKEVMLEVLKDGEHSSADQNLDMLSISDMHSEPAKHQCRILLLKLVSQAASMS
jgi:hypothetical protein